MTLLRGLAALLLVAAVALAPDDALTYSSGAPAGFAGDFSDASGPQTCAVCHSSFDLNSGSGGVSVDAPTQFTPGETLQFTVSVDNQTPPAAGAERRQGFEVAAKDPATGEHVGTLQVVDAANTRFAQGNENYVTHTLSGTAESSWTVAWTAPTENLPASVRLYVAGNAASGGDGSDNDYIYTTTADLTLASVATTVPPAPVPFDLSAPTPNPVRGTSARLVLTAAEAGVVSVRLVDGRGRLVRHTTTSEWAPGAHPVDVPTQGLAPGLYFVVAEGRSGTRTQPLVVAR